MTYRAPEWDVDTVVVGGGQAGLAMGYFLTQQGRDFVILEAAGRLGESWRSRWDSLRLFTRRSTALFRACRSRHRAAPSPPRMRSQPTWRGMPSGSPCRCASAGAPGIYVLGLPFQHTPTSEHIGGVGRDARYIAEHIAATPPAAREPGRSGSSEESRQIGVPDDTGQRVA